MTIEEKKSLRGGPGKKDLNNLHKKGGRGGFRKRPHERTDTGAKEFLLGEALSDHPGPAAVGTEKPCQKAQKT